jgi:hypothetical protein
MKQRFSKTIQSTLSLIIVLSCALPLGCIPNSDSTKELSGNYFYRDEGPNVKDILSHSPNRQEVYSKVIGYAFDEDFILIVQQPIYDEYKAMIGFKLRETLPRYSKNQKEDVNMSEVEADSILKTDDFYKSIFRNDINYWIISNKQQMVFGPFTKDEYERKRVQLSVPEKLQITVP